MTDTKKIFARSLDEGFERPMPKNSFGEGDGDGELYGDMFGDGDGSGDYALKDGDGFGDSLNGYYVWPSHLHESIGNGDGDDVKIYWRESYDEQRPSFEDMFIASVTLDEWAVWYVSKMLSVR